MRDLSMPVSLPELASTGKHICAVVSSIGQPGQDFTIFFQHLFHGLEDEERGSPFAQPVFDRDAAPFCRGCVWHDPEAPSQELEGAIRLDLAESQGLPDLAGAEAPSLPDRQQDMDAILAAQELGGRGSIFSGPHCPAHGSLLQLEDSQPTEDRIAIAEGSECDVFPVFQTDYHPL